MSPSISGPRHVLVVGLAKSPPTGAADILAEGKDEGQLRQKILTSFARLKDEGYEVELVLIPFEDLAARVNEIKDRLRSRKWDGYVIGFGVRGLPQFTEQFEQLVNAGREIVPATPMGFNTRPDDVDQAVARLFRKE